MSNSGRGLSDLYARVSSGGTASRESVDKPSSPAVPEGGKRRRSLSPPEDRNSSSRFERHRDRYRREDSPSERGERAESGRREERPERSDRDRHGHDQRDRHADRRDYRDRDYDRRRGRDDEGRRRDDERDYGRDHRERSHDRGDRGQPRENGHPRESGQPNQPRDHQRDYPRRDDRRDYPRDDRRDDRRDFRDRHDRFDRNDRFESRGGNYPHHRQSSSSVQIPFDRFARLSPWNGSVCPLEERTRHLRNWDAPPAGFERVSADKAKATGLFPPPGNVAKIANYLPPTLDPARVAMLQLLTGGTSGRPEEVASSVNANAGNPAIVKQARRFYVGNLPSPLQELQLADFIERNLSGLAAAGPDAPKRIVSVNVSSDRSYAFVEVKTAEDATMAMNLDGVLFQGVQLKVRRPKEYHLAMTAQQEEPNTSTGAPSNAANVSNAPKMELLPRPLILHEIPDFLGEAHLRALLGMVAELRQFVLLKAQGVAVFEFVEDEQGEEWSGPLLKHTQGSFFVGPFEMKLERLINVYSDADESEVSEEAKQTHSKLRSILSCFNLQPGYATAPHSTSILQLLNLVTRESLQASADEIEADLLAELKTFTAEPERLELVMPRPCGDELVPGVGRVFVRFPGGVEEAVRAATELAGRIFDGRTCIVSFFPEDKMSFFHGEESADSTESLPLTTSNVSIAEGCSMLLKCCDWREGELLDALKELTLPTDMMARKVVFSMLHEWFTSHSNPIIRQAAIKFLLNNYGKIPFSIAELMDLVKSLFSRLLEESVASVRVDLMGLLQRLLRVKLPTEWHKLAIPVDDVQGFAGWFVSPADASRGSKKKVKVNDLLFVVLCFVGANDLDASVRLAAFKLVTLLERVDGHLIEQACKKDTIVNVHSPLKLSVLACGLFAHGIEEQFMKIRFEALNALYTLSSQLKSLETALFVFVDAWLDECDWIRLASLKLTAALVQRTSLSITWELKNFLEPLLAALDDWNEEIRREALQLLAGVRTSGMEAFLRTQRCLEALIVKYEDEVHAEVLQCAVTFASLNAEAMKAALPFVSHLLGNSDARFFAPSISSTASLSTVHQAMLIPLLAADSPAEAKRLAFQLTARFEVPALKSFVFRRQVNYGDLHVSPLVAAYPQRLADAQVRMNTDLVGDTERQFYFPGPAYCRFRHVRVDPRPEDFDYSVRSIVVDIGGFKIIGPREEIKIVVVCEDFCEALKVPTSNHGTCRVKVPVRHARELTIRIRNESNQLEMWQPIKYIFK